MSDTSYEDLHGETYRKFQRDNAHGEALKMNDEWDRRKRDRIH
jgi:hypothetical protein